MLKKIIIGIVLSSSLFSQNFVTNFFKYSTAYSSFSLNAPRYQDDRFAIIGGLSTGDLQVERTERDLKPDFQTSFGLRKIGRFQYEPKRGVKGAGKNPKTAKDKARKKSYYARHNAQDANPDKFSARYWSHKVKW